MGLRKHNASVGASAAFLLGNPVLNPFALVFIGLVLSWQFAVIRLVIGLVLVFIVAWYANRVAGAQAPPRIPSLELSPIEDKDRTPTSLGLAWLRTLWWEIYTILPGYAIIVLLLGAARVWLFQPGFTLAGGNVVVTTVLLALIGAIFVIPTAAEVPIVQTLMHYGLGNAPAAALLITLPAISLPTLWIVRSVFRKRVLAYLAACVVAGGLAAAVLARLFVHG